MRTNPACRPVRSCAVMRRRGCSSNCCFLLGRHYSVNVRNRMPPAGDAAAAHVEDAEPGLASRQHSCASTCSCTRYFWSGNSSRAHWISSSEEAFIVTPSPPPPDCRFQHKPAPKRAPGSEAGRTGSSNERSQNDRVWRLQAGLDQLKVHGGLIFRPVRKLGRIKAMNIVLQRKATDWLEAEVVGSPIQQGVESGPARKYSSLTACKRLVGVICQSVKPRAAQASSM